MYMGEINYLSLSGWKSALKLKPDYRHLNSGMEQSLLGKLCPYFPGKLAVAWNEEMQMHAPN